jgi:serine protease inhibitor
MRAAGAMVSPRTLVADRPFLYVIHDVPTRTPLFVGRVLDPTQTA